MRVGTRTFAGVFLSVACLMPLSAYAITDVVPEDPVVEEPVVEEPDVPDEDIVEGFIDGADKDGDPKGGDEKPVVVTKTPVVKTKKNPSDVKVYKYSSKKNYCPAGLQPVTISGAVSCGRPNQSKSYQQMMAQPKAVKRKTVRRVTYHRSAVPICRPGTKGCSD